MSDVRNDEVLTLKDLPKPAKVCPLLMSHNFRAWAACMTKDCAMWNEKSGCCGLICPRAGK